MTRIATSILSIVLCMIALCSITFAWFTDSVTSSANNITSGIFMVEVVQNDATKTNTNTFVSNGQPTKYTITGVGTVKGYCEITISSTKSPASYYTEPIGVGDSITLTIEAPQGHYITFMGHWGNPPEGEKTYYGDNAKITVPGYDPSEPTPTIEPTPEPTLEPTTAPEPTQTEAPAATPPPSAPTEGTSATDEDDTDTSDAQDTDAPVSEG